MNNLNVFISLLVFATILSGCTTSGTIEQRQRAIFSADLGILEDASSLCIIRVTLPGKSSDGDQRSMTAVNVDLSQWNDSPTSGSTHSGWFVSLFAPSNMAGNTETNVTRIPRKNHELSFFRESTSRLSKTFDFGLVPMDGPFVCHFPLFAESAEIDIEGNRLKPLFCLIGTSRTQNELHRYWICSWDTNKGTGIQIMNPQLEAAVQEWAARIDSTVAERSTRVGAAHEENP